MIGAFRAAPGLAEMTSPPLPTSFCHWTPDVGHPCQVWRLIRAWLLSGLVNGHAVNSAAARDTAPQPKPPLGRCLTVMGPSIRPRPSSPRSLRVGWQLSAREQSGRWGGQSPAPRLSSSPGHWPSAHPRIRHPQGCTSSSGPVSQVPPRTVATQADERSWRAWKWPLALGVWTGPGGTRAGAAFVPVLGRGPVCQPLPGARQGAAWALPCSPGMPTGAPSLRRCFANSTAHMSGNRPVAPTVNSLTEI